MLNIYDAMSPKSKPAMDLKELKHNSKKTPNIDKKDAYKLYPIYRHLKDILETIEPTVVEFYTLNKSSDNLLLKSNITESGKCFANISDGHSTTMESLVDVFVNSNNDLELCKAKWIKDKVIQGRYSKRGMETAGRLDEIGDNIMLASGLAMDIQNMLKDILTSNLQGEEL